MKIISLGHNLFDVFVGDGWENWTRVRYNKQQRLLVKVNGANLPKEMVKQISQKVAG